MENVYPGGVGCIIQKGEWLKKLGEMKAQPVCPLLMFSAWQGCHLNTPWDVMGRDSGHFLPRNPSWSSQMLWWVFSGVC